MIRNIASLKWTQLCCIFLIAIFTVLSSILLYEMDKKYINSTMMNVLLLRVGSTLVLLLVGLFLFKERYTWIQIVGFFLVILGIYLIGNKKDKE
jgi:drug/metabolite transporter (DMT)-like permease